MPTYLEEENGLSLSEALAEAAVTARIDYVRLTTYEIWHPSMEEAIRLVDDWQHFEATLEGDAPRNPFETVTFTACSVQRPVVEESDRAQSPEVSLRIDNVTGYVTDALSVARASEDPEIRDAPWQLIERVYIDADPSAPAVMPVFKVTLIRVFMQGPTAVFTAAYKDSVNTSVPAITFTPRYYVGLLA